MAMVLFISFVAIVLTCVICRHNGDKLQAAAATIATWFATLSGSQKNVRQKTSEFASF